MTFHVSSGIALGCNKEITFFLPANKYCEINLTVKCEMNCEEVSVVGIFLLYNCAYISKLSKTFLSCELHLFRHAKVPPLGK